MDAWTILNKLIAESLHKKTRQKVELLLANPNFQRDVSSLRKKFKSSIEDVLSKQNSLFAKLLRNPKRSEIHRMVHDWMNAYVSIGSNHDFNREILIIANRYRLQPRERWESLLHMYTILGIVSAPQSVRNRPLTFTIGRGFATSESLITQDLMRKNFDITLQNGDEKRIFIELFQDTTLEDIKQGWEVIDRTRRKLLGKKRYYPLNSLALGMKVIEADKSNPEQSDWEKQEEIFGTASGSDWGEQEKKRRKFVKQTRYKYKKRFKPES
jgi:hypothetical protein